MNDKLPKSVSSESVQSLQKFFHNIDELREHVSGWDVEFTQLERGPLDGCIEQVVRPGANITQVGMNRAARQQASSPPGLLTFILAPGQPKGMQWCGQSVAPDSLLMHRPNSDVDLLSPSGWTACPLSIQEDKLSQIAARLGRQETAGAIRNYHSLRPDNLPQVAELRVSISRILDFYRRSDVDDVFNRAGEHLIEELFEDLVMLLPLESVNTPLRDRSRAFKLALDYIHSAASEAITVGEVCEAVGVSWRTLDRSFREHLGVTPKTCIKTIRLQGVRRELAGSTGETGYVADAANNWGFWHMGDFSRDYRREFGVLPSAAQYSDEC